MGDYDINVKGLCTYEIRGAKSREDAISMAYKEALSAEQDSNDAVIINVNKTFDDVIDGGKNIKMINMTGCGIDKSWTLDDCETKCSKYYGCYAVALANDILKEYENETMKE